MNRCSESRTGINRGDNSRGIGQVGEEEEVEEEENGKDFGGLTKLKLERKGLLLSFIQKRGLVGGGGSTDCSTTPVLPWKADDDKLEKGLIGASGDCGGGRRTIIEQPTTSSFPLLQPPLLSPPIPPGSVRKLGAALWEFFQYFSPLDNTMQFGGGVDPNHRLRHHNQRRLLHQHHRHHFAIAGDVGFDHPRPSNFDALSHADLHPATADSLRHQVTALIAKHRLEAERKNNHMQPFSPASRGSSLEITRYDEARTPSSSIEFKARINGEGSYGFKTSSELLKVLNRIWTLEEQHAANMSLVKSLKTELNHAHSRIKELLRDQKTSRHEMDELMKRVSQGKLAWKSREQAHMFESAIQSTRQELEEERKLRMRSEGMHRRLSREMFEVKVALSASVKEVEKERRSRYLLEDLCDEFANGVKEYGMKLHDMKQKSSDVNGTSTGEVRSDSSILHMCELWLDERLQLKEMNSGEAQGSNEIVVDRLSREIQNFLQTQKLGGGSSTPASHPKEIHHMRRNSIESFPLNEGGSAPHLAGNEEDSPLSNDLCFETKQMENNSAGTMKKPAIRGRMKGQTKSDTHLKLEEEASAAQQQHCQNEIQVVEQSLPMDSEPPPVDAKNNTSTVSPLRSEKTVAGEIRKGQGGDDKRSASNKPISELLKSDSGGGGGGGILNRYRSIVGSPDLNLAGSSKARRGQRSRLKILRGFT